MKDARRGRQSGSVESKAVGPNNSRAAPTEPTPTEARPLLPAAVSGIARLLPALLPLFIFLHTGFRGLDFGYQPNEYSYRLAIAHGMSQGQILPSNYAYPSIIYDIHFAALLPELPRAIRFARDRVRAFDAEHAVTPAELNDVREKFLDAGYGRFTERDRLIFENSTYRPWIVQYLIKCMEDRSFYVGRMRAVFLVLSSLAILWVYLAVLALRGRWIEALFASSLFGFSWEVCYHSRFVSTDMILAQFVALAVMMLILHHRRPEKTLFLCLAAASVGLAAGTKYHAGGALLFILLAAWRHGRSAGARGVLLEMAKVCLTFGFAFVATTPGVLIDPFRFWEWLNMLLGAKLNMVPARSLVTRWYLVKAYLNYFGLWYLSPYRSIAFVFSAASLYGLWIMIKEQRWLTIELLGVTGMLLLVGLISPSFSPRWLLGMGVPMAVFSARGFAELARMLPRKVRWGSGVLLAALLGLNVFFLYDAADSIANRSPRRTIEELVDHIRGHPGTLFYVDPNLQAVLDRVSTVRHTNTTPDMSQGQMLAIPWHLGDLPGIERDQWYRSVPFLKLKWFGAKEIDLSIDPDWQGDDRILLLSRRQAATMGLLPRN